MPSPCPCQEDPSLSTRQPLRGTSHEEQFWRNLHAFRGFATDEKVENPAFEIDEKVRREEEMAVVKGRKKEKAKGEREGKGGVGDEKGKRVEEGEEVKGDDEAVDEEAEGKGEVEGEGNRDGEAEYL